MNSAVALSPGLETRWTIASGSMKGSVRVMTQGQFTIGRAPECEFIIANDPKCSRRQAGVRVTGRGCEITSLNDKNPVLVNGREIENATLNDGDRVTLGDTEVVYNSGGGGAHAQNDVPIRPVSVAIAPPQNHLAHYDGMNMPAGGPRARASQARPQAKAGNNKRLYIYGGLAIVLFWLFGTGTPDKKKEEYGLRTQQQMDADIDSANKIKEARENENTKRLDPSITSRQAQESYVRGFRDYRKGQYERALTSFQSCLALDPTHVLCNRYMRLSQRKFNEMIQYYVLLGRKYRDQNQFASCRAAFRNVMVMVNDTTNETYKLAKANYEACNAFVEGRF